MTTLNDVMTWGRCLRLLLQLLMIFFYALPIAGFAENRTASQHLSVPASTSSALNKIMVQVGAIMLELYPLIVAHRDLSKSEVRQLNSDLSRLVHLFDAAKPYIANKSDSYQVSYEFISEYLLTLQAVLGKNDMDFARRHLYAMGEICSSCHTQDSTLRTLFQGISRNRFSSDIAFAEFSYMTREYDQAIEYYDKYLKSASEKTEWDLIRPLQRILTVYAQVQNRPGEAIPVLRSYQGLPQHTPETRAELDNWIIGLESLLPMSKAYDSPVNFQRMMLDVARLLGPIESMSKTVSSTAQQEVERVWLRGRMFHYLSINPKPNEIPILLYWLSVADRSIAYNYYFSLANLYLKQCVLKYPAHPYAQRCFMEYQYYIDHTYTDQGENIPSGIIEELIQMRNILTSKSGK